MVEQNLLGSNKTKNGKFIFKDDAIAVTPVVVDDPVYDTGLFIDRDYDIRGYSGLAILIENTGANSIDYTILGATKYFEKDKLDTTLVDADFVEIVVAEVPLAATTRASPFTLVLDTPKLTAIRLRAKETVAASPGAVRADILAF